jgi:hypothetical protein
MIIPQLNTDASMYEADATYTGWFLSLLAREPELSHILGVPRNGVPRLMLIRLGDRGALKVSPVSGLIVGVEFFGIKLNGIEILSDPMPDPQKQGAVTIPLEFPYDPVIYETGTGEAASREAGFRQIGYRAAASRGGSVFRIQLFRGGPAESYLRIADCALIGLSATGALVEFWLDQVQMPASPNRVS